MDETVEEMRLDALAAAAGVASTTVRLYQQRGLLAGPRLEGRTGWYDQTHLARLRLIGRLQEQGFSLAGIATLLESWEQGRDLADLVEVEGRLDALLHRSRAVVLAPAELSERFPAEALTPELVQRAAALGLVEAAEDGLLRVPDARFLDVGADLADLGVPLGVVLDQWEHLIGDADAIATRFAEVFEAHLLPEDWQQELDADALAEVAGSLVRLQRLAGRVLQAALDAAMVRIAEERLAGLQPPAPD